MPGGASSGGRVQLSVGGITLETSEPLFYLAVSLNMCGYDTDLENSNPVRKEVRDELHAVLAGSAAARDSQKALCTYVQQHRLTNSAQNLAQYIWLALYLTQPPELTPNVGDGEMLPESAEVEGILPLVRNFADAIHLNAIWVEHRAEYEALRTQAHDPLTRMILEANIYLGQPGSNYDGRRFVVLLEPMLAPSATNALLYGTDYFVVASPLGQPAGTLRMEHIRHTYLQYAVEPLVYAKSSATDRLLPLLRAVQQAPLEFTYKSDIVALLSECLIKAIEARTMDVDLVRPKRPTGKDRAEAERYNAALSVYGRQAEAARRVVVNRDMQQGWILTDYLYDELGLMERESQSLKEYIGPMLYSMDVDGQRRRAEQIAFVTAVPGDAVRRAPRTAMVGIDLAEMKLEKGDSAGAEEIAQRMLVDPNGDQGGAYYLLARLAVMQSDPDEAIAYFEQALKLSKDPRTLAWSHIYLGRLYDTQPDRAKAMAEYRAALAVHDANPDTQTAAESGLQKAFVLPKRAQPPPAEEDGPLDPSGKAEKDAYRPDSAK